jgi:hypothetical protein
LVTSTKELIQIFEKEKMVLIVVEESLARGGYNHGGNNKLSGSSRYERKCCNH